MLTISSASVYYNKIRALNSISLSISKGEMVSLIGANGAGKTTALMAISGVLPCSEGEITWNETPLNHLTPWERVSKGIIQVPEGRRIFSDFTVLENLKIGAFSIQDKHQADRSLEKVCHYFPILLDRQKQRAGTLSGGEQQMLAIARAIMGNPSILLLDEPSLGLAPILVRKIFSIIKKINEEDKTTILLVEQNAYQALRLTHRAYVLENGRISLSGKSSDLLKNPAIQQAYLGKEDLS